MNAYQQGCVAALVKLGGSIGTLIKELGAEGVDLAKVLRRAPAKDVEALRNYINSVGVGGVKADLWTSNPAVAQKIHTHLRSVAPPPPSARTAPRTTYTSYATPRTTQAPRPSIDHMGPFQYMYPGVITGLGAGALGGIPATDAGYGGRPLPWNQGRVYGLGMVGGIGGSTAGAGLGALTSTLLKNKAALPLVFGGGVAGALGGSYLGGRTQRPWYNA